MATFIAGLGSAPSVHHSEAEKAWKAAGLRLMTAFRKITHGQCLDAHADLWPAHKAIGLAQAHSKASDAASQAALREMRARVEELDRETGKAFRERCIVRGG